MNNWLEIYCECVRDRTAADTSNEAAQRDALFRNSVFRRAGNLQFPRCVYRPAEAVAAGVDMWALFTARGDIHMVADAMLSLDEIEYTRWRSAAGAA